MISGTSDNPIHRRDGRWLILTAVVLTIALLYVDTFRSIVAIWGSSQTYVHCFIVPAISVYLVWLKRVELGECQQEVYPPGFSLMFGLSLLWLLGDTVGIQVLEQFSVVAMLPAAVLTLLGRDLFRSLRFPLLYLLFAVPFGDVWIPYLIDFTASFTVNVLNMLGIPVFRDGRYFQIPTGFYEVAKACSGLQYFLATFALTTLMSYFFFRRIAMRALFVVAALLLAIVANGIRATTVVLLLHYTNLDIADGKDHEFIGWIIYAVLISALIWLGQRYTDMPAAETPASIVARTGVARVSASRQLKNGVLLVVVMALGPIVALTIRSAVYEVPFGPARTPEKVDRWVATRPEDTTWKPKFHGFADLTLIRYQAPDLPDMDVALVRYSSNRQGAEITSAANSVVDTTIWELENFWPVSVAKSDGETLLVREVIARRAGEERLIWYWMDVNGEPVNGVLQTKFREVSQLLAGHTSVSSAFIVSSPIHHSQSDTHRLLERFLRTFREELLACSIRAHAADGCAHGQQIQREG